MKTTIKRRFDLFTCCFSYKIEINKNHFVLDKLGDNIIELKGSPDILEISVNARGYYFSNIRLENVTPDDYLIIKPAYNQIIFFILFLIAVIGFILGAIYGNGYFMWGPLFVFLLFQMYYIHYKRRNYFKIFIKR